MPATRHWTTDEVRALLDESRPTPRYELVDGELLVTPAPTWRHQDAVQRLLVALAGYLAQEPAGYALASPSDLELEPGTIVQPDLFVLPLAPDEPWEAWTPARGLLLAVEVLSPSSARHDRVTKRRLYQRTGVSEYWIVDPDARVVERWRPADDRPELLDDLLTWQPASAATALAVELAALFAGVHRES